MRVMFTILPATAHLYPIVPLASALHAAGHEVCVASTPEMTERITAAGLTAVPVGAPLDFAGQGLSGRPTDVLALDALGDDRWERVSPYLLGLFRRCYPGEDGRSPYLDDLVGFARAWRPDLVLWDPMCPPASLAALACGAAHGRLLWGLDNVTWIRRRHGVAADPYARWLAPMARRYGFEEVREEMLSGQWSLELTPPRMRLPIGDLRYLALRRVPYAPAVPFPAWLREPPRRPRVCLTFGVTTRTLYSTGSGVPVAELLTAVAGLDVEVVATLDAAQLAAVRRVPENVRVADFLPLGLVLPTCAALVHHGGGGTFAAAVAHRVPQVVVPVPMWDERATARYVDRRGAGVAVDPGAVSGERLRKELARVLEEPSFRDGAGALHAEMRATPGPIETVPVLTELVARHRSGRNP
jgi:glycosyltransferase (activator-dependent family)